MLIIARPESLGADEGELRAMFGEGCLLVALDKKQINDMHRFAIGVLFGEAGVRSLLGIEPEPACEHIYELGNDLCLNCGQPHPEDPRA